MKDVAAVARAWMRSDPDPDTRDAIAEMLDAGDESALRAHFGQRLQFGTAGLRGALGPGSARMNRALVRRVAAGLGAYLGDVAPGGAVVIGRDGRHGSAEFAEDTARVLGGLGFDVRLFDQVCPTPVLAHAVRFFGAAAGVMVTASHNPPQDNGYKVYWADGAQIVPPHDAAISEAIDAVEDLAAVDVPPLDALREAGVVRAVPADAWEAYVQAVLAQRVHPDVGGELTIVYSAMHGVGAASLQALFAHTGHRLVPVPEQQHPDPDFPTVRFPNPEEPGALDRAIACAEAEGADLIIAHDPDADRLAVAVPTPSGWRQLTGNEVGCLLAEDLLAYGGTETPRMVATTIVSSTLLSRIAAHHHAAYAETLTGFKWLAAASMPFEADGGRFVLGYEEALGYSVGGVVRDKDGLSAALVLCDLAAHLAASGRTLLDALCGLYRRHGVHASRQLSLTAAGPTGPARSAAMMTRLRDTELAALAGAAVVQRTDVLTGISIDLLTGQVGRVDLPKSNVLAWGLDDGSRVLARPSGTEPKIKFYFEAVQPMGTDEPLAEAEARAQGRLDALVEAFLAHAGPLDG